jgi:hypothetical protein
VLLDIHTYIYVYYTCIHSARVMSTVINNYNTYPLERSVRSKYHIRNAKPHHHHSPEIMSSSRSGGVRLRARARSLRAPSGGTRVLCTVTGVKSADVYVYVRVYTVFCRRLSSTAARLIIGRGGAFFSDLLFCRVVKIPGSFVWFIYE